MIHVLEAAMATNIAAIVAVVAYIERHYQRTVKGA